MFQQFALTSTMIPDMREKYPYNHISILKQGNSRYQCIWFNNNINQL